MAKLWDILKNDEIDFLYCCACGTNHEIFRNLKDNTYWCKSCAENYEPEGQE